MENLDFNRIHRFRYDDLKLLADVHSGSVHVIDQPTWDFFDYIAINPLETAFSLMMDQYGYETADAVLDAVSSLMMAGQLFTDGHTLNGAAPAIEPAVKELCLQLAHAVDLGEAPTDEAVFAACKEYEKLGTRYAEAYKNGDLQPTDNFGDGALSFDVLHTDACMNCWARFYCSGGCNADLIGSSGLTEPDGKYCTLQRKRLETAIGVQMKLHAEQK